MATRLRIVLEGDIPGLSEHKLSLGQFAPAFGRLLTAVRRIASAVVTGASEYGYGASGGRVHAAAKLVDVYLVSINGHSPTAPVLEIGVEPDQACLFAPYPGLTDKVAGVFLDYVEDETRGVPRSAIVHKYLAAIPCGVRSQRYECTFERGERREVTVSELRLAPEPKELPALLTLEGDIIRVEFEPGVPKVWIRVNESDRAFSATPELVDRAIGLRGHAVTAKVVARRGTVGRLLGLWAHDATCRLVPYDPEYHLFRRWENLLRALAR